MGGLHPPLVESRSDEFTSTGVYDFWQLCTHPDVLLGYVVTVVYCSINEALRPGIFRPFATVVYSPFNGALWPCTFRPFAIASYVDDVLGHLEDTLGSGHHSSELLPCDRAPTLHQTIVQGKSTNSHNFWGFWSYYVFQSGVLFLNTEEAWEGFLWGLKRRGMEEEESRS